jgi:hypothetical protein
LFARRAWSCFPFLSFGWEGWCTYTCCIFHLCIISCLHLCIIDCICIICHRDVLLSYALLTMIC